MVVLKTFVSLQCKQKQTVMTTFENIADILIIKEHIDHALSNSYEGLSYDSDFYALGQTIAIYTRDGEVILMSDKLDTLYVMNNHPGSQANIIEELIKATANEPRCNW